MSFTFSTSNNIGKVRAIIGDTVEADGLLSDEEINVFLSLTSNDLLSAAAMALRRMAASKALLAKIVSAGNYSENTTDIGKQLLAVAKDLDEAARMIPADAQAEIVLTDFNYNNIIRNKVLRGEPIDDA
jgi:hypothetical protein